MARATLYLGYARERGDGFAEVSRLDFDSGRDAWEWVTRDDGTLATLTLHVEALAKGIEQPRGYSPACICEEDGWHYFFDWLD